MTYCVGMKLDAGLVFMSDTRTNAGVDNVAVFRKMYTWAQPDERVIVLLTSGNLATTQGVANLLDERARIPEPGRPSLLEAPSMLQAARLVGQTVTEVISGTAVAGQGSEGAFNASFILGGEIRGAEPRLFQIYPEGNFIESTSDTPFFQIGEHKYGKPILIRAYDPAMSFNAAAKLLCLSFDSTLKSNLSVGMPFDLQFYRRASLRVGIQRRITEDDPYYRAISEGWASALKTAFASLPDYQL